MRGVHRADVWRLLGLARTRTRVGRTGGRGEARGPPSRGETTPTNLRRARYPAFKTYSAIVREDLERVALELQRGQAKLLEAAAFAAFLYFKKSSTLERELAGEVRDKMGDFTMGDRLFFCEDGIYYCGTCVN